MAINQLYISENSPLPDVYLYTNLTDKVKNQIYHRWESFLNQDRVQKDEREYVNDYVYKQLCEELGKKELVSPGIRRLTTERELEIYFQITHDIDINLTHIQLMLLAAESLEGFKRTNSWESPQLKYTSKELVDDFNFRLKQNGAGFQYANGKILRLDHDLLHSETVREVLSLITRKEFFNVNEDFLDAHNHFKENRLDDCLNDCLKAFESTMKIIFDLKGWAYDFNATAKPLIKTLFDNKFLPVYHENQINALKLMLETGTPTVRNKTSGHGAGNNPITITQGLASYLLYLTGATIRFLIESYYETSTS